MKKHLFYEAAGIIFALSGAFLLVGVLLPVITPGLFADKAGVPVLYYVALLPVPLLILIAGWHYNRKAQRLKLKAAPDTAGHTLPTG